jgi:cation diffusion facilitator CzcD-associated flavoprotein CzcO
MAIADKKSDHVDMVIVGAGFAGMYMLYGARENGLSVRCFEAGDGVGGTWYWNRYPGARVDIECLEYSYSFSEELQNEWNWTERYAGQPELLDYANHVADRYNMRDDITFETRVVSTIFNEDTQRWTVTTDSGEVVSAKFCVMATGLISAPVEPDFEGLENYTGEQYMTSRWPKEKIDFSGKRVGVVGTGSSGIQVISEVAQDVGELFVFQRTPAYTIPLQNRESDPTQTAKIKQNYGELRKLEKQSFAGFTMMHSDLSPLPTLSALEVTAEERDAEYEDRWASGGLSPYYAYVDTIMDEESNQTLGDFAIKKMKERVNDPVTAEKLSPDYAILTRRLSPETNYLESFNQDNVHLVDLLESPLERITEKGIVVGGEEIELDVIIFATGFDVMTGAMDRIDIRGREGQSLKERWSGGLTSYLGMMTHGFPNYFWVNGPHSPFYNPILLAEYQGDLIFKAAKQLDDLGKDCLEAKADAEDDWVDLTNTIGDMTLFPKSNNYYMGDNIPGKPRRVVFFLGGFVAYEEQCTAGYADLSGFLLS